MLHAAKITLESLETAKATIKGLGGSIDLDSSPQPVRNPNPESIQDRTTEFAAV